MQTLSTERSTAEWYDTYHANRAIGRDDILKNPGVLMQLLAVDRAVVTALRRAGIETSSTVLDVGCGGGASLAQFLRLGFNPRNLHGVDIIEERIGLAKSLYPSIQFRHGNGAELPYPSSSFDLVTESAMFIQITDEALARSIAQEMLRVVKPGGWIFLTDWRYDGRRPSMRAVTKRRIGDLFAVREKTSLRFRTDGALIPPVGRFLSTYAPSFYFAVSALFPVLVGLKTTALQEGRRA